jgi:hypothetical protein
MGVGCTIANCCEGVEVPGMDAEEQAVRRAARTRVRYPRQGFIEMLWSVCEMGCRSS